MDQDSSDHPKRPDPGQSRRGSEPDLPLDAPSGDVDPATAIAEDDEEARLPEVPEEPSEAVPEAGSRSAMPPSSRRSGSPRPHPASTACSTRQTTCSMSARRKMSASGWLPTRGSVRPSRP